MKPQYTITITKDDGGSWGFRYVGELSFWTRLVIRLAGWKATPVPQSKHI